jgi:hypothetical protein
MEELELPMKRSKTEANEGDEAVRGHIERREAWDRREGSAGTCRPAQAIASTWRPVSELSSRVSTMHCRARAPEAHARETERRER